MGTIAAAAVCKADNCARAVTGTQRGLAAQTSAKNDCSSFLKATVYPSTVTSTVTITVFPSTVTSTSFSTTTTIIQTVIVGTSSVVASTETDSTVVQTVTVNQRRAAASPQTTGTVRPSSVPTYASACSGVVRYSSACSCWGVTQTTTTMPTPATYRTITVSATASTTIVSLVTYTSTFSQTITTSATTTTTALVTATATAPAGNAYCPNGQAVNGLSPACKRGPCASFNLRIEGESETVYEGIILTGPEDITTPSGGTHLCDGTNNNANPSPAGTGITCIADAAGLCGFSFDGTWSSSFQNFFITRIGTSDSNASGGCQTQPPPGNELLWAFDAFNANNFLDVQPRTANLKLGDVAVFTVTGRDGNGGGGSNAVAGATFNGLPTNANGQVVYVANQVGTYRIKATRGGDIRSPAAIITVTA
ncbi:hypothetical protein DL98DRAFT_582011 [Cadophora sp. DSE1049]|nr:hypothetical protein DL98DRAFT_582011 [Cadophora sp. DSE1049]